MERGAHGLGQMTIGSDSGTLLQNCLLIRLEAPVELVGVMLNPLYNSGGVGVCSAGTAPPQTGSVIHSPSKLDARPNGKLGKPYPILATGMTNGCVFYEIAGIDNGLRQKQDKASSGAPYCRPKAVIER